MAYSSVHEQEPWFHKGISAHDAIDILEKEPNGSFLFRPSSSPGFLSLSYKGVDGDDVIHHIRVQITGTQFLTDGDSKKYDSLTLLVKARNSILMRPVYDPSAAAAVAAPQPFGRQQPPFAGGGRGRGRGRGVTGRGAPLGAYGPGGGRGTLGPPSNQWGPPRPPRAAPAQGRGAPVGRGGGRGGARPLPAGRPVPTAPMGGGAAEFDESSYTQLMDMGFTRDESTTALRQSNGNIEQALDLLMGGGGGGTTPAGAAGGLVASGPKPQGIIVAAQGDGSKRTQHSGGASPYGLHGAWGVTDDQNLAHKNYMEDGFVCVPDLDGSAPFAYFAVYDGHSGREATVFAQDQLHLNLLADLRAGMAVEEAHRHAYQLTDQELLAAGVKTAGATVVSALFTKENGQTVLHIANAGDGRAVLCRGGKAERMSFDHKVEVESETKRILALGGTILWGRVQGQTMVSRSLGDHDLKKYVISDPYYHREVLDSQCEFLIVACDGIWDVAEDQEAVDAVRKAGSDAKAASAALIQYVIDKQTKDNLTAMVIRLK